MSERRDYPIAIHAAPSYIYRHQHGARRHTEGDDDDHPATGYMIQDKQGNAIFGIGETVDEAWAQVVDEAGPFFDINGDEKPADVAFAEDFRVYGATAQVDARRSSTSRRDHLVSSAASPAPSRKTRKPDTNPAPAPVGSGVCARPNGRMRR
jgi:hypothetical protein